MSISAARRVVQRCVITDWHPTVNPNQRTNHWSVARKRHDIDAQTAWATAKQAGWAFVPGKVRLTIVLVYKKRPLPDQDNLVARVKGCVDGLRDVQMAAIQKGHMDPRAGRGFFHDDSPEYLELVVRAEVRPEVKCVELELESIE